MTVEVNRVRCLAVGVVPDSPSVYWDADTTDKPMMLEKIRAICRGQLRDLSKSTGRPYAIFESKHGYHFVVKCKSWDEAQDFLYYLKQRLGTNSIMSCRKQRLRISPKIDEVGGKDISPRPVLIETNWDAELRTGHREIYHTYDVGLDGNSEGFLK